MYTDFTYGYAATIHKSQAVTVDNTFVYVGGKSWNRHLTYVAMSRHRQQCHLYLDQETYADLAQAKKSLKRSALKDSVLDYPLGFAKRRGIDISALSQRLTKHLAVKLASLTQNIKAQWQRLQPLIKPQLEVGPLEEKKYQTMIQEFYKLQEKCQQTKGKWGAVHFENQLEKHIEKMCRNNDIMHYLKNRQPLLEKEIKILTQAHQQEIE